MIKVLFICHGNICRSPMAEFGYLMDICLTAQDRFKAYLDYFRIPYSD